jgi:riboflavin kinase / FMN adenylyltransferase
MQVYSKNVPSRLNPTQNKTSVILGFFDGVHRGHMTLIDEAKRDGCFTVVRMFSSIPKAEILLTTTEEKLALFEEAGVDAVIIDSFDELRGTDGKTFFDNYIMPLSPSRVVCGYNYRFGKDAAWTTDELRKYCSEKGVSCTVAAEYRYNGMTVSSRTIRGYISEGKIIEANDLLGRMYSVTDIVHHGKELGRTIGFPTVNQRPVRHKALPMNGIYSSVSRFTLDGATHSHAGVCNIGYRPTVNSDENDITLETYIMGFSGNLYSVPVTTYFGERLRGEIHFPSVDALREQIASDSVRAEESIKKYAPCYGMDVSYNSAL